MVDAPQHLHVLPAENAGFQPRHDKRGRPAPEEAAPGAGGNGGRLPQPALEGRVAADVACPFGIPPGR